MMNFLSSKVDNSGKGDIKKIINSDQYLIIKSLLTRKLIKKLFMPLIYGKTIHSMAIDIKDVYNSLLSSNVHYLLAKFCSEFFHKKYPDIANLMNLINLIGWFCSSFDIPVHYSVPYLTTVQDYMRSDKAQISVYDRVHNKRRRVTLRVPTLNRDKHKTQVSTCVNFIHQRDAYIAMQVVHKLTVNNKNAPIYTVHDNFITTSMYASLVPNYYIEVFMEMGPPLQIINDFIHINLTRVKNRKNFIDKQGENKGEGWYDPNPFPDNYLRNLLTSQDLTKNNKLDEKIDEIVKCYEEYVNTVCGGMSHNDKWREFKSHLDMWFKYQYNYSLHY